MGLKRTKPTTALDAVSGTVVSSQVSVKYADKTTMLFTATGSTIFEVQGSINGVHYETAVLMIPNSPNSSSQNLLRVVSASLSAETRFYALDLEHFGYEWIQIKATVSSGTASAEVYVEY